ncbi:Glycosyl hydrolase family 20, catalytic domain [Chitinophaga arvensicola]|uniref:Glycosyl hydrolase family 20, catalytic domain n=2 Tax=Chitinophaga arvensicola TaxID=29529 RepID=A0A1I0S942_9BACT|nr:Glycosyl hydrolase family 20, catalytic domain [Chitinophaga arvensicola]
MTFFFMIAFYSSGNAQNEFPVRAFHIDLRIQVMKMSALKAFALKLSKGGINTIIMEWEANYPFVKHAVISGRYHYTQEEVRSFVSYCSSIGIDVIPLQQSFGHVEYILKHYRYADLREDQKDYSQINPLKEEEAKALFTDLFKEMISTHASPYIHIGGDETYLLGHSEASREKVKKVGMARLYGDYIGMICNIVVSLGKRPVLWADIAMKYPEALKLLPKETILVDWNYGWDLNRFGDHQKLMSYGFEIWGAPALRSHPDNYFLTDWSKHFKNIADFIPQSAKLGYKGMVMTSWSTSGVYSPVFETDRDIYYLHAIRHVYPLTGFNILADAYLYSLNHGLQLNPREFIERYATTQYGLNGTDAKLFRTALTVKPVEIVQGKIMDSPLSISQLVDSAAQVAEIFKTLKPVKNIPEFEHYRLMSDIRLQYLKYMKVEMAFNADSFNAAMIPGLLKELKALDTDGIDERFIRLNQDSYYLPELKEENKLRNEKIKALYETLSSNR